MASERSQQKQQQEEAEQQQQQEKVGEGGSPAAGSDISSGSDAEAGDRKPPLHPLLAIRVQPKLDFANILVDIDHHRRVPHGWQRCLSLKTGKVFYKDPFNWSDGDMSRNGKNPGVDLRLKLSAYRGSTSRAAGSGSSNNNNNDNNNNSNNGGNNYSPHRSSSSSTSSPVSPPSSCVSSEAEQETETSSMVLVGCPHCLMYVMLSEQDPKCPKCKSTVLLDFLNDPKNPGTSSTRKAKKN